MESALKRAFRARQPASRRDFTDAPTLFRKESPASAGDESVLREAHHRINNNMQLIASLLQLQANCIEDPELRELFKECDRRVRTISLIQQKLNHAGLSAQVNFKECMEALVETLLRTHSNGVKVSRQFDMEPLALSFEVAVPLGLIANELVSDSLKHAFAGRTEGLLRISLRRREGRVRLAIGDDGCGAQRDIVNGNSLSARLVKILTGQIRGQLEYRNKNECVIEFSDAASDST